MVKDIMGYEYYVISEKVSNLWLKRQTGKYVMQKLSQLDNNKF